MTQERRKSNRMDIDVKIKLNTVDNSAANVISDRTIDVDVVNLSKDGLAFVSDESFELNTYYDTEVLLWTKEKIQTVLEVVRTEQQEDGHTLYGCRFIGIMPADQLKIQIYEMVSEMADN